MARVLLVRRDVIPVDADLFGVNSNDVAWIPPLPIIPNDDDITDGEKAIGSREAKPIFIGQTTTLQDTTRVQCGAMGWQKRREATKRSKS